MGRRHSLSYWKSQGIPFRLDDHKSRHSSNECQHLLIFCFYFALAGVFGGTLNLALSLSVLVGLIFLYGLCV